MGLLRTLAEGITWRREAESGGPVTEDRGYARRAGPRLALPCFLDVEKTVLLSHADISALYFVVEDFESEVAHAGTRHPVDESAELVRLLRNVILRWNRSRPDGVYADLFELPWDEPGERPGRRVWNETPQGAESAAPALPTSRGVAGSSRRDGGQ